MKGSKNVTPGVRYRFSYTYSSGANDISITGWCVAISDKRVRVVSVAGKKKGLVGKVMNASTFDSFGLR